MTHILNGDCLAESLKGILLKDDLIIFRECLISGPVSEPNSDAFWAKRASFISGSYDCTVDDYYHLSVNEIEKIKHLPDQSEVCLWFENDLFCQVNMWFVINLLEYNESLKVFRIFPKIENPEDKWKGFGEAKANDLGNALQNKIEITREELMLGRNLWFAYQNADFDILRSLAKLPSGSFQYLVEVIEAHIDRFSAEDNTGRPERVVKEIIDTKSKIFEEVFMEFTAREGIYGFGDSQIRTIFNKLV